MTAVLLIHLVVVCAVLAVGPRLGREAPALAALAPLSAFVWGLSLLPDVLAGETVQQSVEWVPALGLDLTFRIDSFSLLMVLLIGGIGTLVFWYASRYFGPRPDLPRVTATLTLFAAAMLGVVTSDNLVGLYVFWELTSVTSYLLIGMDDRKREARRAARQAILVTGAGGLAMLAGLVLVAQSAGTWSLSELLADPPSGSAVSTGLVLVLLGAFTKSAQFPFQSWLPGAMAAPTPVSAYLHSATMVKAGVYLIARFSPAFAPLEGWWQPLVMGIGLATMLLGGWSALRQTDLKLLLAHGTVSQLGFLVVLFGAGTPELAMAGCAVLLAHAVFKAALFLVVGAIDHEVGTRDLRHLRGVRHRFPVLALAGTVSAASMAGVPPLLGFIGKEKGLEGLLDGPAPALTTTGVVLASALTAAYAARFVWGAFGGRRVDAPSAASQPALALVAPAAALTSVTVLGGLVPSAVDPLVAQASDALLAGSGSAMKLWHGFTLALGLSALALMGGGLVFAAQDRVVALGERMASRRTPGERFDDLVNGILGFADRITGVVQNGSLPVYVFVTVTTAVVVPAAAVLRDFEVPNDLVLAESPLQVAVGALMVALAAAIGVIHQRMAAALVLGAIGYGMAVLFVIQGAPDLALTQLLVETLSVVAFVFTFRHLPDRFGRETRSVPRPLRLALAVASGVFVTAFALHAFAAREAEPISEEYLTRAAPEGGGNNVVNVILVDFRGFDTMGEITVLTVCLLGVVSLLGGAAARRGPSRRSDPASEVRA